MKCSSVLIAICLLISGCATQGVNTYEHKDPQPIKVKNEIIINKPYGQVWDMLVRDLSKSFYVINNIDKESRIINLSFVSNVPADYVDCGSTHRTYKQGDKLEVFDYVSAETSRYKAATDIQPNKNFSYYYIIDRNTKLEGRSNIYIAPSDNDKNGTIITVNTRYVLDILARGNVFAQHFNGNIQQLERMPESTDSIIFNTNTPGKDNNKVDPLICYAKGTLEKEILGIIH